MEPAEQAVEAMGASLFSGVTIGMIALIGLILLALWGSHIWRHRKNPEKHRADIGNNSLVLWLMTLAATLTGAAIVFTHEVITMVVGLLSPTTDNADLISGVFHALGIALQVSFLSGYLVLTSTAVTRLLQPEPADPNEQARIVKEAVEVTLQGTLPPIFDAQDRHWRELFKTMRGG